MTRSEAGVSGVADKLKLRVVLLDKFRSAVGLGIVHNIELEIGTGELEQRIKGLFDGMHIVVRHYAPRDLISSQFHTSLKC